MSLVRQREVLVRERAAIDSGEVEIRPVPRRQLFVGGKPVGEAFE